MLPAPVLNPEQLPPGSPEALLPETTGDCYLILGSVPNNRVAPVRIQAINAAADKFKIGQMLWFNLTDNDIGGRIGTERLRLRPNSRQILDARFIRIPPPGENRL